MDNVDGAEVGSMAAKDVILAKREGNRLTDEQIDWIIDAYSRGAVADEQMAALSMALLLRGMDATETARWTAAMVATGSSLKLEDLSCPTVDKHSTGGVGDKITLALTPLVAACGAAVPQLSGRGLGHTCGTLDKLESISGWRSALSPVEIHDKLEHVGAVISAASDDITPVDRKLYALRDATGTVEAVPLMASSFMCKKIAEGTQSLVLDVKVGSGAFLPSLSQARDFATLCLKIGRTHGLRVSALLTDMSAPLGYAVGNALEVEEAIGVLRGGGPDDVVTLTVELAREMLTLAGLSTEDGGPDPAEVLASGRAYDTWRSMVSAQGGDPDAALPRARHTHVVSAPSSGQLTQLDARAVGVAAWHLGAGRERKEDAVQHAAGVRCLVKVGEQVEKGQSLLELHTDNPDAMKPALQVLGSAVEMASPGTLTYPIESTKSVVLDRLHL